MQAGPGVSRPSHLYDERPDNPEQFGEASNLTPTPNSTKALIEENDMENQGICINRRQLPVGEKCFTLILVILISGIVTTSFGAMCLVQTDTNADGRVYCQMIGGLITALVLVSGGAILILLSVATCIIINECSGRELHGGKCHINCHVFDDLVE